MLRGGVLHREGGREKPEAGRKRKVYDVSGQGGQNLSEVDKNVLLQL